MSYQYIPLTSDPNQEFTITLQINEENRVLKFNLNWNYIGGYWIMKITDTATDEIIIDSVPMVAGKTEESILNLLRQHEYLGIGKAYLVPEKSELEDDHPDDEGLGTDFALIWEG